MVDIGKLQGPEHSHIIQSSIKKTEEMPKTYENIFSSSNIQDLQASNRAYIKASEEGKNPLPEKKLDPYKKGTYPLGGREIPKPLTDIPLNRVGG